MATVFDDLDDLGTNQLGKGIKPLWAVDFKDDEAILKWVNNSFNTMKTDKERQGDEHRDNISAYQGIYSYDSGRNKQRDFQSYPDKPRRTSMRISINHLYDMIEQQVSRETKYRPAVNVLPATADHTDISAAAVVERVIEGIWDKEDIDALFRMHSRNTKVTGESYILCDFDEDAGELHPDYLAELLEHSGYKGDPKKASAKEIKHAMHELKEMPRFRLMKGGADAVDRDGNPLYIDKVVRVGEIKYKSLMAWNLFLEPVNTYSDVNWGFYLENTDLEELIADHPDKADLINETSGIYTKNTSAMNQKSIYGKARVFHLWHKGTSKLDSGRHIVCTETAVLVNEPNPLSATCLPWVRRIDVPVPGQLEPTSALASGKILQNQINNLASLMIRSQALAAHPKWMAPLGSVKPISLANESSLVFYKGGVPPRLEQPNPMAPSTFQLMDSLELKLGKVMGVHPVSRGEAPQGIRAGVALQFLGEQEDERANASIAEHHKSIKDLAELTVVFASTYYDESDGRIEKLLGIENKKMAKYFEQSMLSRKYDFRVQSSSALPRQRAARMDAIFKLKEAFPEKVGDDEALDMIGFGAKDKFISITTVNVRGAEAENEELLRDGKTEAPMEAEDHITHYRIHVRQLSDKSCKDGTYPEASVGALKDHIEETEMLMWAIVTKNPKMLGMVTAEFPMFPMFFDETQVLGTGQKMMDTPQMEATPEMAEDPMSDQEAMEAARIEQAMTDQATAGQPIDGAPINQI